MILRVKVALKYYACTERYHHDAQGMHSLMARDHSTNITIKGSLIIFLGNFSGCDSGIRLTVAT